MKYFTRLCTLLFINTQIYSVNLTLLHHIQSIQTSYISQQNDAYGDTIKKAFQAFYKLSKNAGPVALMRQTNIENLFLLSEQKQLNEQFNYYLKNSKNIMLVYLYLKIFQEYIDQTQKLLEESLNSLQYWETEKFYDKLPMLRKHPVYWYHSPAHKKLVCHHTQALKNAIEQATLLLGISLHGLHQLDQIQDMQDVSLHLNNALDPLMKYFQTIKAPSDTPAQSTFQDTIWVHQNIQLVLQNHEKALQEHAKPHHIIRHGFAYSCLAIAAIGTYTLYKTHEQNIPEYKEKTTEMWNYFFKEYVNIPLQKLKETLFDKKFLKIQELEKSESFKLGDDIQAQLQVKSFKFLGYVIELPPVLITILAKYIDPLKIPINDKQEKINNFINTNAATITELSKDQQLNFAMFAIFPAALATCGIYYSGKSMYNKFIKHETWYHPMQMIVREIDKILNKLTAKNTISFADDGMLHVLTRRLKTYISCLPNEELQLIEQDLRELSAYHLSYQQKRGVLDRMYRTYEFLK